MRASPAAPEGLAHDALARLGRLALDLAAGFERSSSPATFCATAVEAIAAASRCSRIVIVSLSEDVQEATVLASRGPDGRPLPPEAAPSRSLLAEMLATGTSLLVDDARKSLQSGETSVVALDLRSVVVTPLFWDGAVRGAIVAENTQLAEAFTEGDVAFLEAVASLLAPSIRAGGRLDAVAEERARLEALVRDDARPREILGRSPAIAKVLALVDLVKDSDAPVLVEGESGTGKELVARALHFSSRRRKGPFVAVNCAAIPETLIESELLGHERGAFTGAAEMRVGRFEQAHGGTLFLDEIGELRTDLQARLLRVVQERSFERVGGMRTVKVDVRLVAATNKDLRKLVAEGRFREDLLYRLDVLPIRLPPLRERPEDIPLLAVAFVNEISRAEGRSVTLSDEALTCLQAHPFPGNVRELRNVVHRVVAMARTEIVGPEDLPEHVTKLRPLALEKNPLAPFLRTPPRSAAELKLARRRMQQVFDRHVRRLEGLFLESLLEQAEGNVSEAARRAGMNRTFFHKKLRESRGPAGETPQ